MNKDIIKKYNYLITNSCAYDVPFVILVLNNYINNLYKIASQYSFVLLNKENINESLLKKLIKARRITIVVYDNIYNLKSDINNITNIIYPEKLQYIENNITSDYNKLHEYIVSKLDKN